MTIHKKIGDSVKIGEDLVTLHFNKEDGVEHAVSLVLDAYKLGAHKPESFQLVHEVID
jgi:pyrimidine-nucleoside phosphorylase